MPRGQWGHYKKFTFRQFLRQEWVNLFVFAFLCLFHFRFNLGVQAIILEVISLGLLLLIFQAKNNGIIIHNTGVWVRGTLMYGIALTMFQILFIILLLQPILFDKSLVELFDKVASHTDTMGFSSNDGSKNDADDY